MSELLLGLFCALMIFYIGLMVGRRPKSRVIIWEEKDGSWSARLDRDGEYRNASNIPNAVSELAELYPAEVKKSVVITPYMTGG